MNQKANIGLKNKEISLMLDLLHNSLFQARTLYLAISFKTGEQISVTIRNNLFT
jgi:hypothetical protein